MTIGIILAAGQGWRLQAGTKKAFIEVAHRPLIYYSLTAFLASDHIDMIMVVVPPGCLQEFDKFAKTIKIDKPLARITGSDTRFRSLRKAVKALPKHFPEMDPIRENVITHNAANPLVTMEDIKKVAVALRKHRAAGVGIPVYDTLRRVNHRNTETLNRDKIWRMQTPQGLWYDMLIEGFKLIPKGYEATDELQLAEVQGVKPRIFHSSPQNFKITTEDDLILLEDILGSHREYTAGLGEDSHAFAEDGVLKLGGLEFPKYPALEADSDGDVMLHALVASLLQGLGMGSLGTFTGKLFDQGITDSREYLELALFLVEEAHWRIDGLSFVFECLEPKIDKISKKLKKSVASLCRIAETQIAISAHTGDGLTAFARGEGIRCQCLLTLTRLWM